MGDPLQPDIEIVARVRADELRFDAEPEVEIRFPGSGKRDSRQVTTRTNIDKPIKPGKSYRRVFGDRLSVRAAHPSCWPEAEVRRLHCFVHTVPGT